MSTIKSSALPSFPPSTPPQGCSSGKVSWEPSVLADKTILITGGTGSFGQTAAKKFLALGARQVRIFSRDEKKQEDMRRCQTNPHLRFFIGDVRDPQSLNPACKGVDFIFHAAALKQVPSCEFYPLEAIKTNILGAENVLTAAGKQGVARVVVLSTDKAVYPINAMGLSKALMEKLMIAKARLYGPLGPILCATRYGNVMGSRGSVIPLFIQQILQGRPLTLTDPAMTRFLMSLDDSVDLILYGLTHGQQGDIFVQKAPACTVGVLAEAVQALFSSHSPFECIGHRPGEKLYESLLSREERSRAHDLGAYYRVPADHLDFNPEPYFSQGNKDAPLQEDYTSHNTTRLDFAQVKALLLSLEFVKKALSHAGLTGAGGQNRPIEGTIDGGDFDHGTL
jgi:UDP-N-acetylglucosamine 4,6-dehydratase/5-epimerase